MCIQKDIFFSKRFDLVLQLTSLGLNIIFIGTFATVLTLGVDISNYGTSSYLDYLLTGSIIHTLIFLPRGSVSMFVLSEMFPLLYNSPASLMSIFIGINSWRLLWNSTLTFIIALIYVNIFGLNISINLGVIVVVIAGIVLIFALDLFSAGFRLATKASQDPLNWFLDVTAQLVSGLYFPPDVLPTWLQPLAKIHPETYILRMGRLTLSGSYPMKQILPNLAGMICIAVVLLMLGYLLFLWGLNKARELGTLGHM